MSKFRPVTIVIISFAAIVTGIAAVAYILFIPRELSRAKRFSELVDKADTAINTGSYNRAVELLDLAVESAKAVKEYRKVLKLGYQFFLKTNNMDVLSELSEKALREKPDDADIIFIAAYTGIRKNDYRVINTMLEKRKKDERLLSLKAEALIESNELDGIASLDSPSPPLKYLRLFDSKDPQFFEDAGNAISDTRLVFDALLLHAANRNFKKACQLYLPNSDNPLFTIPGIFILFDACEYKKAEEELNKIFSGPVADAALIDLYGDIMVLTGKTDDALRSYIEAIEQNPAVSETAYLNLSFLYRKKNDRVNAFEWLKAGKERFPGNGNIIFEASKFFLFLGDRKNALSIAESAPHLIIEETKLKLLRYSLQQEDMNQQAYRSGLWEMFNANPKDELICRFLVLYLININDIKGAISALTLFDKYRGITSVKEENLSWVPHYRGICGMMSDEYRKSLSLFDASLKIKDDPVVMYHKALLQIQMKDYRSAREDLWRLVNQSGSSSLDAFSSDKRFLSMAVLTLGKALFLSGSQREAYDQVERALSIDPGNYQAIHFRKELQDQQ